MIIGWQVNDDIWKSGFGHVNMIYFTSDMKRVEIAPVWSISRGDASMSKSRNRANRPNRLVNVLSDDREAKSQRGVELGSHRRPVRISPASTDNVPRRWIYASARGAAWRAGTSEMTKREAQ